MLLESFTSASLDVMRLPIRPPEIAPRLAAGAFILNSGLGKAKADDETAKRLHGLACGTYPFLADMDPAMFARLLAAGEITIGALLLAPVVPTAVAGATLTVFAGGLLGMYLRTPGMRKPGSLAPTPQGVAISKDVWMLGIGLGLLTDALARRRRPVA